MEVPSTFLKLLNKTLDKTDILVFQLDDLNVSSLLQKTLPSKFLKEAKCLSITVEIFSFPMSQNESSLP